MKRTFLPTFAAVALLLLAPVGVRAAGTADGESPKLEEVLEGLILKSSPLPPMEGFASYYAKRFEGRRTTSGHRYHPDKLTAAHESLPLGTVVRVVNPATNQEVHVTITDRCARKAFHFIDLSRAAAKKIGLWGKGRIKVVIIPLLQEKLEKPT
ncbi:MAG: septal ring lytic transglycosylase RlpA family protein [Oryzomonas sp.]|uniref:septal ring lytic transglycosylase RlpA family protein n=1 Tax=Oryzomonas sp. TaxID=2855186 RepID=UPI00284D8A63|nr:septal ring lytic transglycosylase RlpA family protein [Oryzomonas sp.]MDR3580329.1 septal ring lytic transglycosylase RlpA family protein [Oryzomonas sp.]